LFLMSFIDTAFPRDIQDLRHRLLHHPLWQQIEDGTLDRARLRVFALQDWWVVREAYRLDALTIAGVSELDVQELLISKLHAKVGGYKLLVRFGEALGLTRADFDVSEPLVGCIALTNFFFYMLTVGRPEEKLAAVSASEDIFVQICARIAPALMQHYWLNEEQIAFFTAHDEIGELVTPVDETLLARYTAEDELQRIVRAVRLSHEFELMFYDTVLNTPLY
jgi:thiaminase/transcriptional activator TenA